MCPVVCTDYLMWDSTALNLSKYLFLGKLNRGISVVDTVRILKGDAVTEDDIFKATVLGWLIEFVSCSYQWVYIDQKLISWT